MRRSLALLATFSCFPALWFPAWADEPTVTLPDVVVTATRVPTAIERIPAGVSVITREMIEDHGFDTLAGALSELPGVRVSPAGGPGGQASIFVRGTNSNHVLVLRDGMPINDPSEATGAFNFGIDTLSDIERIEVIRGPMAALYGSGAIGGVINLISRKGTEQGFHLQGDLSGGGPAQVRGSIVASGVQDRFDYAFVVEAQSQRGYDAVPQRMSVYTGTPQGFRDRVATMNLGYSPVEGTRLSLFLRGRQALFGFNNLGFPIYDTANSSGSAETFLGRVGVTSKLFNGTYETSLFVGRLQDGRHYKQPLDLNDPNLTSSDGRYNSYRTDVQWNNTVHLDDLLPLPNVTGTALTFGYEYTGDSINVSNNADFAGSPFSQAAKASMADNAMYVGLQTTLLDRMDVTGQIRQDWVAGSTPTTWRLGTVVRVPEIWTNFKASYGTAFRAPSLFDRYGLDSYGYVGNPLLAPEKSQGWELGFVTTIPAFGRADFARFSATYFNQQVQNLITTAFTPVYTSINIGSAHIQGVETELTMRVASWLLVHATYTYTDTLAIGAAPVVGTMLLRRPPNTAAVDLTITPVEGLKIVPQLAYTGAFRDYLYDNGGFPLGYGTSPQGLIARLAASYDVTPRIQLYLNTWNIFHSKFESVNGYQIPGPTGLIGVRFKL